MILLISGSVQAGSRTLAAVTAAACVLEQRGLRTRVWDLAQSPLPIADPRYYECPADHPDLRVRELVEAAAAASGFVLASPLYHNAYCGALKNCLDHLSIEQFASKPVGLISFGGTLTAIQVCDQLQIVVRGLYGLALPVQVVTVPDDFERLDGGFRLVAADRLRRLEWMADEICQYLSGRRGKVSSRPKRRRDLAAQAPPPATDLAGEVERPVQSRSWARDSPVLAQYGGDLYLDQALQD